MSHKLKGLSLALMAMFVLGAAVASSASAVAVVTSNEGATITGEQITGTLTGKVVKTHEFTSKVGAVKCTTVTFHGVSPTAEAVEQTLNTTFSGCILAGIIPAHVALNGCDFLFTANTTVTTNRITASVHVLCPSKPMELVGTGGSTCVLTMGSQTLSGIELHNIGTAENMEVEVTFDVSGVSYEIHGTCPNNPTVTTPTTDGAYRGVAKLQASGPSGITVH